MLVGLYQHNIPVDLILFADTGAEHPHTYQFIQYMNQWLSEHGMPQITTVEKVDRAGNRLTLEMECLRSCTLPSIAYGHKRCSLKHKIGPQEKFCNHYAPCREVWASGGKVNRFIGFDAGEMRRYLRSRKIDEADKKYYNHYPLIEEWGWDRSDCVRVIQAAGLPQPGKSSCFLPQHEAAGNFESERTRSRLVSACAGAGSQRHAQPKNHKRIGTQLLMAGTIWKGVNHYGNEQIGAH